MMRLENMSDFFTARVNGYDKHMLENCEGCQEGYIKMVELVAGHYAQISECSSPLLDLGCGTGLELEEIIKRLPNLTVTGVDLTEAMLIKLQEKFHDKDFHLICGIYVECDYMVETQDEEEFYFAENTRLRSEQKIPEEAFFHYDTPCTIENQMAILGGVGFCSVEKVFRVENTSILVAGRD